MTASQWRRDQAPIGSHVWVRTEDGSHEMMMCARCGEPASSYRACWRKLIHAAHPDVVPGGRWTSYDHARVAAGMRAGGALPCGASYSDNTMQANRDAVSCPTCLHHLDHREYLATEGER